jgi:predicted RNA-binding Zn ribbon-like protein
MTQSRQKSPFEFTGGNLCLDFTNTVDNRGSDHPKNLLVSYGDLLQWGSEAGVLSAKLAERLRSIAEAAPGRAQSVLREAVQLRDALYTIFSAVAERRGISDAALGLLNRALQRAAEHARLVHSARRFSWEWMTPEEHMDFVLWPIARSAADLLVSDKLALVGRCASESCSWLFLDTTKNHRRRWCEMRTCGNRDKARRYYQRSKD